MKILIMPKLLYPSGSRSFLGHFDIVAFFDIIVTKCVEALKKVDFSKLQKNGNGHLKFSSSGTFNLATSASIFVTPPGRS